MLLSSEPPAPHVLPEYTEGRSTRKGGRCPPQEWSFPSALFTKAQVAHPLSKLRKSSLQVCKGNYSQMSISQGNLERLPSYYPPPPGGGQHRNLCAHPQMPQQNTAG